MFKIILIATIFFTSVANLSAFAAPTSEQILEDNEEAFNFAVDWLYDLVMPIIGLASFGAILGFWLKTYR